METSETPNIREQHHFSSRKVVDEGALKILEAQCKQCQEHVEDIEDTLETRRRISSLALYIQDGSGLEEMIGKTRRSGFGVMVLVYHFGGGLTDCSGWVEMVGRCGC